MEKKIIFKISEYEYFIHYMKNHPGIRNAIISKNLEKILRISGVKIRAMKHYGVVKDAEIIGATTDSGYFYIETKEELDRCINDAQSRINALRELIEGYQKAWKIRKINEEIYVQNSLIP